MAEPERFGVDPGPDPRAVSYLEAKGLQRSHRWSSMWREQHAYGFTMAGVYRLDVLDAAHKLVTDAVRDGETYETFKGKFVGRMKALGFDGPQLVKDFAEGPRNVNLTASWRMKVIYDTNVRAAYAASEWQAIEDTVEDFPALEYLGVTDERTRASHKQWFGTVRLVGDVFWRTHYPPNDWYCRCYVIQISVDELADGGVKLTSDEELAATGFDPDPKTWPVWTDSKTGRSAHVPPDVGPGFAYNAGQSRRENVADLLSRRIASLDPNQARAAAFDLPNLPQFRDMVETALEAGLKRAAAGRAEQAKLLAQGVPRAEAAAGASRAREAAAQFGRESLPVGYVPAAIRDLEPKAGGLVVVNPSGVGHSADAHPTPANDWRRVQQLLEHGEIWRATGGELTLFGAFVAGDDQQLWMLVLKPLDGAWRVKTLFPTSPRRQRRITAGLRRVRHGGGPIGGL
jgi:SPP1 gp7 family putative phage head morphogenesis protein